MAPWPVDCTVDYRCSCLHFTHEYTICSADAWLRLSFIHYCYIDHDRHTAVVKIVSVLSHFTLFTLTQPALHTYSHVKRSASISHRTVYICFSITPIVSSIIFCLALTFSTWTCQFLRFLPSHISSDKSEHQLLS